MRRTLQKEYSIFVHVSLEILLPTRILNQTIASKNQGPPPHQLLIGLRLYQFH